MVDKIEKKIQQTVASMTAPPKKKRSVTNGLSTDPHERHIERRIRNLIRGNTRRRKRNAAK